MTRGKLEVFLYSAKGLENADFLTKMDPYVKIIYGSQVQESSVATKQGSEPEWNQTLIFSVSEGVGVHGLLINIMDSDTASDDDFVGEAIIPLDPVFLEGSVPPTQYIVVKHKNYCGEIKIGLTYILES